MQQSPSLPNQLYSKLDLSGCCLRARELPGVAVESSVNIVNSCVGRVRQSKIRVIQDVEELRAKLNLEDFRDPGYVLILEE
jgi:hypothetical protein